MQQRKTLIKKLIKEKAIFTKSGLKSLKLERAKDLFSMLNIRFQLISDGKSNWTSAIYFPTYTQFLLQARIWKTGENFFTFFSLTKIENTKKYSFSELNQILLEHFCYKLLEKYFK